MTFYTIFLECYVKFIYNLLILYLSFMADPITIKLLVVGDGSVGKTCILLRHHFYNNFNLVTQLINFQQSMSQLFLRIIKQKFMLMAKKYSLAYGI